MDMASLQNLMNRHVFAYEGLPLRNLTVEPDGQRLKMKGKLHKGVDIPFSRTGERIDDRRWPDAAARGVDESGRRAHQGVAGTLQS